MIWREKRILLGILGVLLLANLVFFFTYRVQYQSRLDALDTRLEELERQVDEARLARIKTERTLQAYRKVESDVQQIFNQHWSTQTRRLTLLISEVKRLAVASSLIPQSYSYERGDVKPVTTGGRNKETVGASEVSMGFSVRGSYEQARRLINLLELSRQFVIIESIGLVAGEGDVLTLNLRLKTIFRDDSEGDDASGAANNRL
ncbi:MAG: hypothetical protein ACLGH0_03515 [Thermoanaerobaculia bacterium]